MVNSTWELVSLSEILSHIMLAYRTFASISELGPAVAHDCRPMYLFMFAGLSPASILDLGAIVAANVRIHVGRSVFCQYSDLAPAVS